MKIMLSLCLFSFVMFISMSMASVKSDARPHQQYLKRMSRHAGQQQKQRYFRHIMGKLIDTETNTIYNIDGQKQFGTPVNADAVEDSSLVAGGTSKYYEDLACLEACYTCVEDFPVTAHKKKAADNCGPMCDCADNCSRIPIEQVNKIYGQSSSTRGDKGCFWRTYTRVLNHEVSSLA